MSPSTRTPTLRARTLLVVALLAGVGACSTDTSNDEAPRSDNAENSAGTTTPTPSSEGGVDYDTDAVGFGEGLNTAWGHQRVLSMTDPAESDAVDAPAGTRVVAALVEECASDSGPTVASSAGWSAVTEPAPKQAIAPAAELQPTKAGSPSIDDSRAIDAGACGMADLLFVVPDELAVLGFHFEGDGSQTGTWIKSAG